MDIKRYFNFNEEFREDINFKVGFSNEEIGKVIRELKKLLVGKKVKIIDKHCSIYGEEGICEDVWYDCGSVYLKSRNESGKRRERFIGRYNFEDFLDNRNSNVRCW